MLWTDYLFGFAEHAAAKSKDSTKVGAVLIDRKRHVLCTGFNGPPRNVRDLEERRERPAKYLFVAHAEANLIATAARRGIEVDGCTVYVTHHPCADCAKMLIQAGVETVIFGEGKTAMPSAHFAASRDMFHEAGVACIPLEMAKRGEALTKRGE